MVMDIILSCVGIILGIALVGIIVIILMIIVMYIVALATCAILYILYGLRLAFLITKAFFRSGHLLREAFWTGFWGVLKAGLTLDIVAGLESSKKEHELRSVFHSAFANEIEKEINKLKETDSAGHNLGKKTDVEPDEIGKETDKLKETDLGENLEDRMDVEPRKPCSCGQKMSS